MNDVFANPSLSAGPFKSVQIVSSQNTVGENTNLQLQIELTSLLKAGSMVSVQIP